MPWTAPEVTRPAVPRVADERTMLEAWLDWHRQTLLMKCAGLSAEQLKLRSATPSTLTLHGLVRHMVTLGGKERTEQEFATLLRSAGLTLEQITPINGSFFSVVEATPA